MSFMVSPRWVPLLRRHRHRRCNLDHHFRVSVSLSRFLHHARTGAAGQSGGDDPGGGDGGFGVGNAILLPGATVAAILMLGILHARHMYKDKMVEDMKEKGIEIEFSPDFKAAFLRVLPLRTISRFCGFLMGLEIPVPLRPFIYKAWARAFHSNLEEAALPLGEYASVREFFIRKLKDGSRPIDFDPNCLVSPVDGIVLRFGELGGSKAMIEQVKGFSYSAFSLLGATSCLHEAVDEEQFNEGFEQGASEDSRKRWWRVSITSPKERSLISAGTMKGVFYCVLYLTPGDYHRVHSPADWHVFRRRYFSGRLFPVNERAARTIRNLYVENERVVLEGKWKEGFMAIAAIGATNVGSIRLLIEPKFRTNKSKSNLLQPESSEEQVYGPDGTGVVIQKGEEIAAFNMGSTVVLIFQAPISRFPDKGSFSSEFLFCVTRGARIKVGEAIGRWKNC